MHQLKYDLMRSGKQLLGRLLHFDKTASPLLSVAGCLQTPDHKNTRIPDHVSSTVSRYLAVLPLCFIFTILGESFIDASSNLFVIRDHFSANEMLLD